MTATAIEWQHVGDVDWTKVVSWIPLKGDPGADGNNGSDGTDEPTAPMARRSPG